MQGATFCTTRQKAWENCHRVIIICQRCGLESHDMNLQVLTWDLTQDLSKKTWDLLAKQLLVYSQICYSLLEGLRLEHEEMKMYRKPSSVWVHELHEDFLRNYVVQLSIDVNGLLVISGVPPIRILLFWFIKTDTDDHVQKFELNLSITLLLHH